MRRVCLLFLLSLGFVSCRTTKPSSVSGTASSNEAAVPTKADKLIASCNNLGSEAYDDGKLRKEFYPNFSMKVLGSSADALDIAVLSDESEGKDYTFDLTKLPRQGPGPYRLSSHDMTIEFSELPNESNTYWWVTIVGIGIVDNSIVKLADNSDAAKVSNDSVRILCFKGQP